MFGCPSGGESGERGEPLPSRTVGIWRSIVACFRNLRFGRNFAPWDWRGSEARADGWRVRRKTLLQTPSSHSPPSLPSLSPSSTCSDSDKTPPRQHRRCRKLAPCVRQKHACVRQYQRPTGWPFRIASTSEKKEERKHPHYSEKAARKRITHDEGFSEAKGAVSRSWASS